MNKSTSELLKSMKSKKTYEEFYNEEIGELYFKSIAEYLDTLIRAKGLKKADIIKKSNLDRNYAYQIFNGQRENPSRNKILMLAFGMELTYEETATFLKLSKQPELYVRDLRDSAIIFGLNNGESLMKVNERLENFGLELLE